MSGLAEETAKTYRGNCHCGAFIFEVKVPEIKSASACDCSICSKKGYVWLVATSDAVNVVKDEGLLVDYAFGAKSLVHKFCGKCGTATMASMADPSAKTVLINIRAFQDFDVWGLEIRKRDGAKHGDPYQATPYTGPEPAAQLDGDDVHVYHGSCHCGAVTAAVKVDGALGGSYKGMVLECDCSICARGGYIWIYPTKEQVRVVERDGLGANLSHYVFGSTVWRKAFCRTCGVHLMNDLNPLSDAEVAALPEPARQFRAVRGHARPVTLRAFLDGAELDGLAPQHSTRGKTLEPLYVNP
ncbi:Mss4-like protein [Lasiosphaeria miniovina]|uniref:Mss4-like protein n=1 Tax=Lasiosphaeria miniovina TaxID=1954250 RepID=A0AA40ALK3_9PEZI|nr:Mss4-like protein [Lasiosphaeria miniovina]KAK0718093.1 Mss4-like protein [Lasiosphaeria miniovina]